MQEFYVFGSASSKDLDVLFIVDHLEDTIDNNHRAIDKLTLEIAHLSEKEINGNLGILENGVLVKVFKGTSDEVNNSILKTYNLHTQYFPLRIEHVLNRDVIMKVSRCARTLLSFFSRTEKRPELKKALRGSLNDRMMILKDLDLTMPIEGKKESIVDIYKVLAFQLCQILSLMDGKEIYTKEECAEEFPSLSCILFRQEDDENYNISLLNFYKTMFIIESFKKYTDQIDYLEPQSEYLN